MTIENYSIIALIRGINNAVLFYFQLMGFEIAAHNISEWDYNIISIKCKWDNIRSFLKNKMSNK